MKIIICHISYEYFVFFHFNEPFEIIILSLTKSYSLLSLDLDFIFSIMSSILMCFNGISHSIPQAIC